MICKRCGENNVDGSIFCIRCGNPLTDISQNNVINNAQSVVDPTVQPVQSSMSQSVVDPTVQPVQSSMSQSVVDPTVQPVQSSMPQSVVDPMAQPVQSSMPQSTDFKTPSMDDLMNPAGMFKQESSGTSESVTVPQSNSQPQVNNEVNGTTNDKPKNKIVLILLLIIIVAVIIGVVIYFVNNKKIMGIGKYNDNAFFIEVDGKKLLFNDDGKRLTDIEYIYATSFSNGTAVVENPNKEYGIINSSGKMVLDYGKYKYIYSFKPLYKACYDLSNCELITGSGQVLYNSDGIAPLTYGSNDSFLVLKDEKNMVYRILNNNAKEMIKIPINSEIVTNPIISSKDNYISVYYENKTYIIDLDAAKVIKTYDGNYCLSIHYEDDKIWIIGPCNNSKTTAANYIVLVNGKEYNLGDKCDFLHRSFGTYVCTKNKRDFLLDKNFNDVVDITDGAYYDDKTYAIGKKDSVVSNKSINTIEFYENGNLVNTVSNVLLDKKGYTSMKLYSVYDLNLSKPAYVFYNSKGELAFDKKFRKVYRIDPDQKAYVTEDGNKAYMINEKGERLYGDYDSLYGDGDNYHIVKKSGLYGIVDDSGNNILDFIYNSIEPVTVNGLNKKYVLLKTTDSKYIVYCVDDKKEVLTYENQPSFYRHYITTTKARKLTYYTYTGNVFYEEK